MIGWLLGFAMLTLAALGQLYLTVKYAYMGRIGAGFGKGTSKQESPTRFYLVLLGNAVIFAALANGALMLLKW